MFRIDPLLLPILINQNQVLERKIKIVTYLPKKINKGELPKSIPSCCYCNKKGHIVSECWVLKRKNENKPQGSIACNA